MKKSNAKVSGSPKAEKKGKRVKSLNVIEGSTSKSIRVNVLKDKCEYLYRLGHPFYLTKQGSTYELESEIWNTKAFRSGFKTEELNFIKSVRHYIDKNGIGAEFCERDYQGRPIRYISVGAFKPGEELMDLVCVDINGAYWQTAYRLGVLPKYLYRKGLRVDKRVRLAALGSLAKTRSVWRFDGKELRKLPVERSPLENVWFAICAEVAELMVEVQRGVGQRDFVFYWVDGIYVRNRPEVVNKVVSLFLKHGYTSKFEIVPYIKFSERGFKVGNVMGEKEKVFCYSMGKGVTRPISKMLEEERALGYVNQVIEEGLSVGEKRALVGV